MPILFEVSGALGFRIQSLMLRAGGTAANITGCSTDLVQFQKLADVTTRKLACAAGNSNRALQVRMARGTATSIITKFMAAL